MLPISLEDPVMQAPGHLGVAVRYERLRSGAMGILQVEILGHERLHEKQPVGTVLDRPDVATSRDF